MGIIRFEAPTSESVDRYPAEVAELLAATAEDANAAYQLDVKALDTDEGKLASAEKVAFQRSANLQGYTARCRATKVDEKSGTTSFIFTLIEKYKPRRGKTTDSAE